MPVPMLSWPVKYYWYVTPEELHDEEGQVRPPKVLTNPYMWLTKCRHTFPSIPSNNLLYPKMAITPSTITITITMKSIEGPLPSYRGQLIIQRPRHAS